MLLSTPDRVPFMDTFCSENITQRVGTALLVDKLKGALEVMGDTRQ